MIGMTWDGPRSWPMALLASASGGAWWLLWLGIVMSLILLVLGFISIRMGNFPIDF